MITGIEMSCPITVVAWSRLAEAPATCGANPSSANDAVLSEYDVPASEPASRAPYTDGGQPLLRAALRLGDGLEPGALAHEVPLLTGNPRNLGTSARGLRARTAPAQRPVP